MGGLPPLHAASDRPRRADRRRLSPVLRARAGPRPPLRGLHELRPHRAPGLAPARPRASGARPGRPGRRDRQGLRGHRRGLRAPDRGGRRSLRRGADRDRPLRPRHAPDPLDVPHQPLARGGGAPALPDALAPAAEGNAARLRVQGRPAAGAHEAPLRARARLPALPAAAGRGAGVRRDRLRLHARLQLRRRGPGLPRRGERRQERPEVRRAAGGRARRRSATRTPASPRSPCTARRSSTTART